MTDNFSTSGVVATSPRHLVTQEGLPITNFRLAVTQRRFNRDSAVWENTDTNWFTVTAFRQLALNVAGCVSKGDRIVVTGRLKIREWESGERTGTVAEIDANAIGHDLAWGTASFVRTVRPEVSSANEVADDTAAGRFDPDDPADSEARGSGDTGGADGSSSASSSGWPSEVRQAQSV